MGETTELYPGHAEELRRHQERIARIEAAAANPLPGPLLAAFAHVPLEIGGFTIRPMVHYDFVLLARLESPLAKHLSQAENKGTPFSDEQGYEMVWQFCRPARQVKHELDAYATAALRENPALPAAEVARAVRDRFRARAVEEVGLALTPPEAMLLVKAVEREFLRAFSTVVNYERKPETGLEEGSETFPVPPPKTTASAGGSVTSAV